MAINFDSKIKMAFIRKFEDLEIWQIARRINKDVIEMINNTKLNRDFILKDQISRASSSIMNNIAEGFGRGGTFEFIQFLSFARGSANELRAQIFQCIDKSYIESEKGYSLEKNLDSLNNQIAGFINYLNRSKIKGSKFLNRDNNHQSSITNKNYYAKTSYIQTDQKMNNQSQTTNSIVKTSSAAAPLGAYPHARKVGNLLFLSGIGSRRAADNVIPGLELDDQGNIVKYDIEAECHSVFANVKAVLEASGSSWNQMIDVTVFLTNMKKDFPVYNKIYGEYFAGVEACRTTVEVKSLPTPIAIELKVIAMIDSE